jgi:hypothetical protein
MTIVFEGIYPIRCQGSSPSFIFLLIDLCQMRRLAPAFIVIILTSDEGPVILDPVYYFTALAENLLGDHLCPVRGFCSYRAYRDTTNSSDHCGKLNNESSPSKFYAVNDR